MPLPSRANNTQTIARNTFWFGLEVVFGMVATLGISIAVARVIGPVRLGQYNYLVFLTSITAGVGSSGLAITTRKFMAEYLNSGQPGVARSVYENALTIQVYIATAAILAGLAVVGYFGDPSQRTVAVFLVLSMAPRLIAVVPSQANNAAETLRRNTTPSLCGALVNFVLTAFSLWKGWGLTGISFSFFLGSTVELVMKLASVHSWIRATPRSVIPPELKKRMMTYSGQGVILMILNIVVWDRSDLVVLKWMNPDIRQVAFFSTSFGFVERIALLPNGALGAALGSTMMAQFGANKERINQLAVLGAKYTFLLALPLLLGVACISGPFIRLAYGTAYLPMIPVLTVTALMAIPKVFSNGTIPLLQTTERLGVLIWIGCGCGVLDIGLDFLLTPGYGALGAALANGIAQTAAAAIGLAYVSRSFHLDLRVGEFARIAVSGLAMAAAAFLVGRMTGGLTGLLFQIVAGILVWLGMLRLTSAITPDDRDRLLHICRVLPTWLQPGFRRCAAVVSKG